METVKVISYVPPPNDFHMCEDEAGNIRRIDVVTSGCLADELYGDALVGKLIEFDYTHPFIEMAEQVRLKEE